MAAVKLALLQQEAKELQQGVAITLDETVSHSVLIATGLDLEEQQYVAIHYLRVAHNFTYPFQASVTKRPIDTWEARYSVPASKRSGTKEHPSAKNRQLVRYPTSLCAKFSHAAKTITITH